MGEVLHSPKSSALLRTALTFIAGTLGALLSLLLRSVKVYIHQTVLPLLSLQNLEGRQQQGLGKILILYIDVRSNQEYPHKNITNFSYV